MKTIATLSLAMIWCCSLAGCTNAFKHQSRVPLTDGTRSEKLTCKLFVPAVKINEFGWIPAFLILRNEGSEAVPICTDCTPNPPWSTRISWGQGYRWNLETTVGPGKSQSDSETLKGIAESIVMLQPKETFSLPLQIWPPGTNTSARVLVHYEVPATSSYFGPEYETLKMWRGKIDAEPLTIRIRP
jgi:hypothetical protein